MIELAYDARGTGPLLVLVHGITEDRRSWDPLTNELSHDHTVLRVDLRGHGQSPAADGYDPLADFGADLAGVIDEPPLLVGHSLGGLAVTSYAAGHDVRGVINIDQPLRFAGFTAAAQQAEPALRGPQFDATVRAMFDAMRGPLPDDEWARLSDIRDPRSDVVLGTWAPLFAADPADPAAMDAAVRDAFGGLDAPYLNLLGSQPDPDYAAWLAEVIPGASVQVWDEHGHYPHLVEPARFAALVREFEEQL